MSDFPDLGSDFATAPTSAVDEIDFDRAASAFPDISLGGDDDFASYSSPANNNQAGGFSFDSFDSPSAPDVKVTGDDEIDKFEDQFPELDTPVPQVSPNA